MDDNIEIIKKLIEGFLRRLCVDFEEVVFLNDNDFKGGTRFLIKTNESGLLIGSEGATVQAINHLIKKMIWKKINSKMDPEERINFFVDVNDYQGKNIERIKSQALDLAEKAILFKRDVEMPPMSSYERMIVHSVLADNPDVFTESIGENGFRRLVIKTK
ncbi:MAG: R3H domain-containing nucleic acid-binding protein [Patescibacteria group bacterium]|nr:R3H domain-containing nucleic acid-binding protein [Patescibacteria group bacterium]